MGDSVCTGITIVSDFFVESAETFEVLLLPNPEDSIAVIIQPGMDRAVVEIRENSSKFITVAGLHRQDNLCPREQNLVADSDLFLCPWEQNLLVNRRELFLCPGEPNLLADSDLFLCPWEQNLLVDHRDISLPGLE